jgi:hypothetical protein
MAEVSGSNKRKVLRFVIEKKANFSGIFSCVFLSACRPLIKEALCLLLDFLPISLLRARIDYKFCAIRYHVRMGHSRMFADDMLKVNSL